MSSALTRNALMAYQHFMNINNTISLIESIGSKIAEVKVPLFITSRGVHISPLSPTTQPSKFAKVHRMGGSNPRPHD